jgi:glucose/arabinose dehydrogenase
MDKPMDVKDKYPLVKLPEGYKIEKVVGGLSFPTSLTWDKEGKMYVIEAGGGFLPEPPPARILQVEMGKAREVVNLSSKGVIAPVVGFTYYNNNFYITHRSADLTGAVSRVAMSGGAVSEILTGFLDSQSEHPLNDIKMGPDGRMYLATGPAANSAVVGMDLAPFVMRSPGLHTTTAKDLVMLGKNFKTADFRTMNDLTDTVLTGAYVPFGTPTTKGQVIKGTSKPGGAIVSFDPANAEGTLQTYAFGLRNVIGLTWNKEGKMYAAVNGYDVRGSRPVKDIADATYEVKKDTWYGWPDYSATLDPLTNSLFEVPDSLQAMVVVDGKPQGKNLGFVIDHAASGLTPPDKSLIAGLHTFHSSPSLLDVAPTSWGEYAGQLFIAEWGDLAPPTDPTEKKKIGYQIVRVNPQTKQVTPFVSNHTSGPASMSGAKGQGLERPFDVKFGPDGAMYIVDYGQVNINMARTKEGREPYEYIPNTGIIWKVTKK